MMKIQIKNQNSWLETLLKQHFNDLEFVSEGDIIISEDNASFHIHSALLNQNWQLTKPASILRVINIINQAKQALAENIIKIGPLNFYPNQRLCLFLEEEITLTQKETEILLYLSQHPCSVDKATLLAAIWGYSTDISTHTLETHIYKLRSKFLGKYELISSNEDGYALNHL